MTGTTDTNTRVARNVVSGGRAGGPHLCRADPPSLPETVSTVAGTFD
jgi:hypothetical protein